MWWVVVLWGSAETKALSASDFVSMIQVFYLSILILPRIKKMYFFFMFSYVMFSHHFRLYNFFNKL